MNSHSYPTFPSEADRLHAAGAVYYHDYAGEIDTEEEILADMLGVTPRQARGVMEYRDKALREHQALILGRVVSNLIDGGNMPVMVCALAFAAGLDQLNGAKSQSKIAEELGVTRALMSHYVVGWRDTLSGKQGAFDNLKFRKKNTARAIFKEKATDPFTAMKAAAIAKLKTKQKQPCN